MTSLENANPTIYQQTREREITAQELDDDVVDEIDSREIFDILCHAYFHDRNPGAAKVKAFNFSRSLYLGVLIIIGIFEYMYHHLPFAYIYKICTHTH